MFSDCCFEGGDRHHPHSNIIVVYIVVKGDLPWEEHIL